MYAGVLGRDNVKDTDSFVSLGGDSLSYVAASLELEKALGHLPQGWHLMTVGETCVDSAGRASGAHGEGAAGPSRRTSSCGPPRS